MRPIITIAATAVAVSLLCAGAANLFTAWMGEEYDDLDEEQYP